MARQILMGHGRCARIWPQLLLTKAWSRRSEARGSCRALDEPDGIDRDSGMNWWLGGAGVGLGALVFAGWLAVWGHGTYLPAMLLFPYSMGGAVALGGIGPALLVLAVVQYPVYGALVGAVSEPSGRRAILRMLISLHLLAAVATVVLAATDPNFWP